MLTERRDERPPAAAAGVLLIHLELHADVTARGVAPPQVRDERVRDAEIRIVAPQHERRRRRVQRGVPRLDEPHLAGLPRIVEEADVAIAHLAAQLGREAVRRHVQHRLARVDGARDRALDRGAIGPVVRRERRLALCAGSERV